MLRKLSFGGEDMANVGRPRDFKTVEDMSYLIDRYFNSITKTDLVFDTRIVGFRDEEEKDPIIEKIPVLDNNGEQISTTIYYEQPTIIALCKYLDIDRKTLSEYEKRDEFSNTIKKAKEKIEDYLERQLSRKDQVTGIIFNLKNNFGWVDKTEAVTKNTNTNENTNKNIDLTHLTTAEIKELLNYEDKTDAQSGT